MQERKKLFPSMTFLLGRMRDSTVALKDLEGALFYFGCTNDYMAQSPLEIPEVQMLFDCRTQEGRKKAEETYVDLDARVVVAGEEGRAVFRQEEEYHSYRQLNQLLRANGIDTSSVDYLDAMEGHLVLQELREWYADLVDVVY